MKALPILWKNPSIYEEHIILPGVFHLMMGYCKMIMKKMAGSGIIEILLEANMITSGSVKGVISGKNYYRAMNCHLTLAEAMRRLLFQTFLTEHKDHSVFDVLLTIKARNQETVKNALTNKSVTEFLDAYEQFENEICSGIRGKTAQYWLQYVNLVRNLELMHFAVKRNEFQIYAYLLFDMSKLFFAYNGQNYARHLAYFSLFLMNLHESHPGADELLRRGAISVARSFIPGNREEVDKVIEETFNRHGKSRCGPGTSGAGLSGIMTNQNAYQRWVTSAHERIKFVESQMKLTDMVTASETSSRHLKKSSIIKSELQVRRTQPQPSPAQL